MKLEKLSTPDKHNGNGIVIVNDAVDANNYILKDREPIKPYNCYIKLEKLSAFLDPIKLEPVLDIEKHEGKRYDKTTGKVVETITTSVYHKHCYLGCATCDKTEYDEREGVLNAIANFAFRNFDREYDKYKKYVKKQYKISCKCSACGKVYDTPEQARECETQHIKNKKERRERYRIRAEAKRRLAAEEYEKKVKDMMNKISEEENTN
jgi:hypothetical protein